MGLPNADLAPTGRAKCIHCGEAIAKGAVRIAVLRDIDTGSFTTVGPGYLHPACVAGWAEQGWARGLDDLVQQVRANTALEVLPAPFGDAPSEEPARPAKQKAAPPEAPPAPPAPVAPPIGALTSKKLASLAAKLAKADSHYKGNTLLEKAGVDWRDRAAVRWHLVRHGLIEATHPSVLSELAETASGAELDALFTALPQLGVPPKKAMTVDLLPGWSYDADTLALSAFARAPDRLEALLPDASPTLRRGLQFVRGRCGAPLDPADTGTLLDALATAAAKDWGLSLSSIKLPDGSQPFRTADELGERIGGREAWLKALTAAARKGKFGTLEHVLPALVKLPLRDLVRVITKPHFSSGEQHDALVERLLTERADDPRALLDAALTIPAEEYPGHYLRNPLLLHAIARLDTLPAGVEHELDWSRFTYVVAPWSSSPTVRAAFLRAVTALGPERSAAVIAAILEKSWGHGAALPPLSVHFDEDVLRRLVAEPADGALAYHEAFGALGARALPALREALEADDVEPKRRSALLKCLHAALGGVGFTGGIFDAAFDRWLTCWPGERYWGHDQQQELLRQLAGMTEPRRTAVLGRLLDETKQVERPLFAVQASADPALRARAAALVVSRYAQVSDTSLLAAGLHALGPDGLALLRGPILAGSPDPKLFDQLRQAFGYAPVEALRQEARVVEEAPLARLLRLAAARRSEHPDEPSERIYLLERRDLERTAPERRAGSWSASRGAGPGMTASERGEREHVLTLDLDELPELAARFPGARGLSLWAAWPEQGDAWDRALLLPVPADRAAPADGRPISVVPLDVPSAIFEYAAAQDDPTLKELRKLVFNRPGYALGAPMFIQGDDEAGFGFVMQLAEQIGSLNLGDSGSLYVFSDTVFMQCY